MKNYLLTIGLAGLILVSACKKETTSTTTDSTPSITGKTNQQIFMMQKWFLKSWRDSTLTADSDAVEACMKDDTYEFKTTTLYILDRKGTYCSQGEPATENYSWSMPSATSTSVNVFGQTYTIESMTGDLITLTREYPANGGYGKQTVKFSRKQ